MTHFSRALYLLIFGAFLVPCTPQVRAEQYPENMYSDMRWRMIGPFRGGRTRAAAGAPTQPNVFYIGAVDGGVWKSDDYGRTWWPIFDDQPTQSIGSIAVAPSDPNVVYVGSGEGLHRPDLSVGDGVYKSTDAGKTWSHMGLGDSQQIPAIAVDPGNPNRLFAAVLGHPYGPNPERGIFRSTDGGSSWDKVLDKGENTGGCDVAIDPSNPNVIYACLWQSRLGPTEDNNAFAGTGGGLFKSTDGGATWRKLTNGLPEDLVQINVAIAASDPKRIYATVSTTHPSSYATDEGMGFYRSDDGGENWSRVTQDARSAMKIGGGDQPVPKVDPKNADVVYSTGIVTARSRDGGKTWDSIRGAPGGDDYQNMWINPEHPNIILLVSDQGAVITVNGGATWSSWYNQPTAQLYHVITDQSFPYKVCGAQQESGSLCTESRGNDGEITFRDWHPVGVIEYGYVAPDPLDPDIIYGAGRNEVSRFHWSTGQTENVTPIPIRGAYRVDRTEPLIFSPVDPHRLYYAANQLFETRDRGHSWREISSDLTRKDPGVPPSVGEAAKLNPKGAKQRGAIYSVAPGFHDVNTIWAGTDDGLVWITRDGGKNWKDITPQELTGWSKVTQIAASHFDNETAYISVSRFRRDDLRPYIYRTHDGGKTWQAITGGLPDKGPVDTVREDVVRKNLVFCGTETGVWVSFDGGDHWQSLQLNLPHTAMRDLWIQGDDLVLGTHGRSFWILDDITPLRQMTDEIGKSEGHLFEPAQAFRIRRDTNTDTPLPADEPAGENPPDGAILDYFLGNASSTPVTLEILDSGGKQVRRYSSADQSEPSPAERREELIPSYWLEPSKALPSSPGMHRWVWDLRYPAPFSSEHEYPIAAVPGRTPRYPLGPTVLPGRYTVELTAGGKTYKSTLTVKMDPRVKTSTTGLEKKFELEQQLASAISGGSKAVSEARSVHEQLTKLGASASPTLKEAIPALNAKVSEALEGGKEKPDAALSETNSNLIALYKDVEKADAEPTVAQDRAASENRSQLSKQLTAWNELKAKDIPSLNERLRSAGQPEINLAAPPQEKERGENEE